MTDNANTETDDVLVTADDFPPEGGSLAKIFDPRDFSPPPEEPPKSFASDRHGLE